MRRALSLLSCVLFFSPAFAHVGGISGGGGNVMVNGDPAHAATLAQTVHAVRLAEPMIRRYLLQKQNEYLRGLSLPRIFSLLFQQSIDDVLQDTKPIIQRRSACVNSGGFPVDGSTVSAPGTVCISALNISLKVDRSQLIAQSAALLAHEFSERAGFTDDEAIELQFQVLADFSR